MRKNKPVADMSAIHRRLNKQLNRLIKLAANEKELMDQLSAAKYPSDANGIQTDLEDVRRNGRIIQTEVALLQQEEAATYLPYLHTPINPDARPLPQVPTLDADQLAAIDTIHYPEWTHDTLDKEQDFSRLQEYYPSAATIANYWLNDAIVMEYLKMVAAAAKDVFIVDSLLAAKISAGSQEPAARYRKVKLLSFKKLLFPICMNNHWTLAAWDADSKTLSHYDSLNSSAANSLYYFKLFLNARKTMENPEPAALCGLKENLDAFPAALKQKNAVDCGVYVCMAARSIIQNFPFTFSAANMNPIRKCMLYELITNDLLNFI